MARACKSQRILQYRAPICCQAHDWISEASYCSRPAAIPLYICVDLSVRASIHVSKEGCRKCLVHSYFRSSCGSSILALSVPRKPTPPAGSWQVDTRHSDAQFISDGTTDFGKTKINFTIGFARVAGVVKLDSADSANSSFDFTTYSAASMAPHDEDGKVKTQWIVTPPTIRSSVSTPRACGKWPTAGCKPLATLY